jgi:glutamate-ammonia-ligase adenylyltransferase
MKPGRTADTLTHEELAALGLADTARARRLLIGLAGKGVTDDDVASILPQLLDALAGSPDPDRALLNFVRWADAIGNRTTHFRYLAGHPTALTIYLNVCGVSQYFSDILARNPEYFEIIANPGVRSGSRPADVVFRELSELVDCIANPELKLEAMRRFRHREMLRIGVRDILGIADMPTTAREFSSLADACIQKCYALARERVLSPARGETTANGASASSVTVPRFAVIALGKLGGSELNYSSDIDLIFVCDAGPDTNEEQALRLAHVMAESIVNYLSRDMQNGHLFRVDMRLRPEGRFGALVRTLSSYRSYYENWAETWERQAMIKARPVAGDARLGQEFLQMVAPHAFPRRMSRQIIEDLRENKRRIERGQQAASGPFDVKLGPGGIRDVEFTVQFLQMERGALDPLLRTPNTLQAIARLRQARVLSASDARQLTDGYVFLRVVEHRLQLLYDHQTQKLPAKERELGLLARRLGLSSADEFRQSLDMHRARVRDIHLRLFWREESRNAGVPPAPTSTSASSGTGSAPKGPFADEGFLAALATQGNADADAKLSAQLAEEGFHEPERCIAIVRSALYGTTSGREAPEAEQSFLRLMPRLLESCARVGDPDTALHGVDILSQASPNRAEWYQVLYASPDVLHRLVRLASGSRTLVQTLARNPEWLDLLFSEAMLDPNPKPASETREELQGRLPKGGDPSALRQAQQPADFEEPAFWEALARYAHRERLRIGARDIWGEASATTIAAELTYLSEALIGAVLDRCCIAVAARYGRSAESLKERMAIIGLGKLGGCELAYTSDLDITFVCDDAVFAPNQEPGGVSPEYTQVNAVAEMVLDAARMLRSRGVPFVLDARLRPEGRFGPLVRSVSQYGAYYSGSADTWERQVLVKARPVAGSRAVAAQYMQQVHDAVYGRPISDEEAEAIRTMKRRIENERLRPDERHTNLKLGFGGLSDIEFTAQLWQMRCGCKHPSVRQTSTVEALHALAAMEAIPPPDAARLAETYTLLSSIRNRLALLTGQPIDAFPQDQRRARALAIELGTVDSGGSRAEDALRTNLARRMEQTRRIVERLFFS